VYEAIDEGKIYYPPEDAPTQPSQRLRDVDIATGFATSANDAPPEEEDVPTSFEDSDWDIAQRVTEALRLHAYTSDMQIRVHVREGVVMLRGRVDNLQDAAVAEDIASEVEGVEEVREQLTVG
jgi:osmotically-inducible protein OsmY